MSSFFPTQTAGNGSTGRWIHVLNVLTEMHACHLSVLKSSHSGRLLKHSRSLISSSLGPIPRYDLYSERAFRPGYTNALTLIELQNGSQSIASAIANRHPFRVSK